MGQIRLAIADNNLIFMEKLGMYLHKNQTIRFSLELFSSPAKLENWLEKGENADLIAISSSFFSEMIKKPDNKNVLILADSAQSLIPEGYNSTYKFRQAESLMKEIIAQCAESLPQGFTRKDYSGTVHMVLYVDGGDAANPIAQTMAEILSESLKPAFYCNLDELSNTDSWFSGNSTKGLSEMLYYVKAQKVNLSLRADSCISRDTRTGTDFIKGHKNPEDISQMTASECQSLIGAIRGRNYYRDMIISRAFRSDALLPMFLKEADKIYLAALDYCSSIDRLSKAVQVLARFEEQNNIDLKDKVVVFITPIRKDQRLTGLDIPHYSKTYLPFPFEETSSLFTSSEYQAALKRFMEKGVL